METRTHGLGRRWSALRWAALGCSLALGALAPTGLAAAARDHVLQWVPPSGSVTGYRVWLGQTPSLYDQIVDLGLVLPDVDGFGRATVTLDATRDYFIALSAYNDAGESPRSNEIELAASVCDPALCDDLQQCTADDCGAGGCTHAALPDGTFCAVSGSPYGMCIAGACQAAQCTQQSQCDDGDLCNGAESCSAGGACLAGVAPSCGEPTQCTVPSCDPRKGCLRVARANGTPCNDGKRYTKNDACQSGYCVGVRVRRKQR